MNEPHDSILEGISGTSWTVAAPRRTRHFSPEFTEASRSRRLSRGNPASRRTRRNPSSRLRGRRSGYEPRYLSGDHRAVHRAVEARHRALAEALVRRPEHRLAQAISRSQFPAPWLHGLSISVLAFLQAGARPWRSCEQRREVHAGHLVIYYKILERRDDTGKTVVRNDGKPARVPFVRWANVFNLDQTEGIQAPAITANQDMSPPRERAAAIVENAKLCPIHHAGFAACYSPTDDVIRIPAPSTFHSHEDYYHTLYHELTHASGHSSRLDREGVTQQSGFGSERYSKEELVAELGAAFLSNEAGIIDSVRFENSAAYLGSWVQKLENDPKLIVSAASQAQKASDFIRGIEHKESLQERQKHPPKECRSPSRGNMESTPDSRLRPPRPGR